MKTYTTKQGDMWDSISLSQYGSVSFMNKLMMANTQYVGTYVFPAGVVLNIPEFDNEGSSGITLPPWKRVT